MKQYPNVFENKFDVTGIFLARMLRGQISKQMNIWQAILMTDTNLTAWGRQDQDDWESE